MLGGRRGRHYQEWIGYLVRYEGDNSYIYRIYDPKTKKVSRYRDIIFLALNTLFLRDINIYLYIPCSEEGEGDIIRTSYNIAVYIINRLRKPILKHGA
jgi:hypothetical protein